MKKLTTIEIVFTIINLWDNRRFRIPAGPGELHLSPRSKTQIIGLAMHMICFPRRIDAHLPLKVLLACQ
jgi:hypothetical protein